MAMRATTSGTSTRTLGLISDADLHGPHNNGNVMVPVVGEAACATVPSVNAVSGGGRGRGGGGEGGWTERWWPERWGGEKKKRRREMGGRVLLYPKPTCLPQVRQVPHTCPVNINVTCHLPVHIVCLLCLHGELPVWEGAMKPMSHYLNSLYYN